MEVLSFTIDADCNPAVAALGRVEQGIDSLSGKAAAVGITTSGVGRAMSELAAVQQARKAAGGMVEVGYDSGAVSRARSDLGGLRDDFQGAAKARNALSNRVNAGVTGADSVGSLADNFGRASSGARNFESNMGRSSSAMDRHSSASSRASSASNRAARDMGAHTSAIRQQELALAGAGQAANDYGTQMQRANSAQGLHRGTVTNLSGTSFGGGPAGGGSLGGSSPMASWGRASGGSTPPPGWGPPGGGGGGFWNHLGGGDASGRGLHDVGRMGAIGGVIGIAESLVAGAAGMMAVNQVIKDVPALALAANRSMNQFTKGVREAGKEAIAEGVPGIRALGGVLRGLGSEVGAIGAAHMGETLTAVSSLAGTATRSLHALEPAMGPGITGIQNMGNAIMNGIASESSVQGITSVGNALSNMGNAKGVENLTSGLSTLSTLAGKVGTDVIGSLGNLPGMGSANFGPSMQSGLAAGMMTKSPLIGLLTAAGTFQAQQLEAAGRDDMVTPGAIGGIAGGVGGHKLGKTLGGPRGGVRGGIAGYLAGDALGLLAAQGDKAAGSGSLMADMAEFGLSGAAIGAYGGPWGAAAGLLGGAAVGFAKNTIGGDGTGGDTGSVPKPDSHGFPTGVSAPWGWNRDDAGTLTPSRSARDSGTTTATPQSAYMKDMLGGGIPTQPEDAIRQLQGGREGQNRGQSTDAKPMADMTDQTKQLGDATQNLGPKVNSGMRAISALGQQSQQMGQQVQQVPQAVGPTLGALSTVPAQAAQAMEAAHSAVNQGGGSIGASVPKALSSGIAKNTGVACDAAADMTASTVKCGASALQAASPSKKFVALGEGIGQGLAIGARSSTGEAVAAVGNAMTRVVQAGQASLQAASPSKTFQAEGAKAVRQMGQNTATGIGKQSAGLAGPPGMVSTQQQQANAQAQSQAQQQAAASKTLNNAATDQQRAAAARRAMLEGNAMRYRPEVMDRIVAHNQRAADKAAERDLRRQDTREAALKGITPLEAGRRRVEGENAQATAARAEAQKGRPAYGREAQNRGATEVQRGAIQGLNHTSGTQQAQAAGVHMADAYAGGINSKSPSASRAGGNLAHQAGKGTKKEAKISSPSGLMVEYGRNMVEGLMVGMNSGAAGVGAAAAGLVAQVSTQINSNGLSGFAVSGLKLGNVLGENAVTGAQQIIQKNMLRALTTPTGLAQRAMVALAGTGLGAPAGSGASTWNQPNGMIAFGGGVPATPMSAPASSSAAASAERHFHLYLDGKPFQTIAQNEVREALETLAERIPRQRG